MASFYINNIKGFLEADDSSVVAELTTGITSLSFELNEETLNSWKDIISQLRPCLANIIEKNPKAAGWSILLEYIIPMINQRIDCVLIAGDIIFVIEFKGGDSTSGAQALRQAQDYTMNLEDFHEESRHRVIIPIALGAFKTLKPLDIANVEKGAIVTHAQLEDTINNAVSKFGNKAQTIEVSRWDGSRYFPVPSIIDAVTCIYDNHDIKELANSKAGAENLKATQDCITQEVADARKKKLKKLIILTGVPGAGKTLAGLNAVQATQGQLDAEKEQASFLSGNGPLVLVLQEALKRSARRNGRKPNVRSIQSRIRNMHVFVRTSHNNSLPPAERLLVFDEAQRAWNAAQNLKKFGYEISEPDMILDIMARHEGWAVIVALVGGGQEIHGGEAGLAAWGDAVLRHPDWDVITSPEALHGGPSVAGSRLFSPEKQPAGIKENPALHLSISKRSIESESTAAWVNAVLSGEKSAAKKLTENIRPPAIFVSRDLKNIKKWLTSKSDAGRRVGLVASSEADRLRAEGIETPAFDFIRGVDVPRWFLENASDHRSSNQLEIALSEFEMQGLEIDVSCLIWDNDLVILNGKPQGRRLKGNNWVNVSGSADPQAAAEDNYTRKLNKYRVLLTRFRHAMVIYVPIGSVDDPTRDPNDFNDIYDYLKSCGLKDLEGLQRSL
jgi:hypothetical protein